MRRLPISLRGLTALCLALPMGAPVSAQTPDSPAPLTPADPSSGAPRAPRPGATPGPDAAPAAPNTLPQSPLQGLGVPPANSPLAPGGGGTNNAPAAADPANAGPGALFDNRLPGIDQATGMIRFNGQTWDVANNPIFAANFETFLNAPEELGKEEEEYRATLNRILALMDPSVLTPQSLTEAYRLLNRAAGYVGDGRQCDALSNAIYAVWQSKRNQSRLAEANQILEEENKLRNSRIAVKAGEASRSTSGANLGSSFNPQINAPVGDTGAAQNPNNRNTNQPAQPNQPRQTPPAPSGAPREDSTRRNEDASNRRDAAIAGAGIAAELQEKLKATAQIKANEARSQISELSAKIEYQTVLVQLFLQRRFHHLVIGTRFYRAIFVNGDSKLNLPDNRVTQLIGNGGTPPTVASLELLANEAMRRVQNGVKSFHSFVDLGELDSASKRLAEAYIIGEFMPEIRTLPWERKRKVLAYTQKANMLKAALETKDYTLASELIHGPNGLKAMAKDFDATKPNALIETSRNMARLHLAKARNAALSGDKPAFELALAEAGKIWPNNPELIEIATKAFNQGDVQAQALVELDQLIAQKNFRRIAEEAGRFLAATHLAPAEKQAQLKAILEDFKSIEAALMGAKEMDRQGNPAGAWEAVETVAQKFPDDLQLAQARALYTTKAADFVRTVQNAQEHDRRSQAATSLAWFLKAQRIYPKSQMAEEAIQRLKVRLLSQSN